MTRVFYSPRKNLLLAFQNDIRVLIATISSINQSQVVLHKKFPLFEGRNGLDSNTSYLNYALFQFFVFLKTTKKEAQEN